MNKKVIIQIVVILAGFIGAGMVLYNGFFKGNASSTSQLEAEPIAGIGQEAILPYGVTLDFNILKKQNLFFNQVIYPKLDPNNDYGVAVENLIVSPPSN